MNIIGNDIYITRGEAFALDFDIVNKDGSPYILHKDLENPHLLITITSNVYEQDERYLANYWIDLSDEPKFVNTRPIKVSSLNAYPPSDVHYNDDFLNDVTGKIAVFTTDDETYKYYLDGKYVDYALRIVCNFNSEEFADLRPQSYGYSVKLVSGKRTEDYVKEVFKSKYPEDDEEQIMKMYNILIMTDENFKRTVNLDVPLVKINTDAILIRQADLIVMN